MFTTKDLQGMSQLRRALQMFAATLSKDQAREVATVYPQWAPGVAYEQGQYIKHGTDDNGDPVLYQVAQGHTSSEEWAPADNPALYTCVTLTGDGWPVWAPPSGAQDAYNAGDVVSHQGQLWQSKIDGNTTEPGTDDRWWSLYEPV